MSDEQQERDELEEEELEGENGELLPDREEMMMVDRAATRFSGRPTSPTRTSSVGTPSARTACGSATRMRA
jgi:hypothetical protein